MKRLILFLALMVALPVAAQDFGHGSSGKYKIVSDTTGVDKSIGRMYFYTGDSTIYMGNGTYLSQRVDFYRLGVTSSLEIDGTVTSGMTVDKIVVSDSGRNEGPWRQKGEFTAGATATPTVLSTDGSVSQTVNSANAAKTVLTIADGYEQTTGQQASSVITAYTFKGTSDGGSSFTNQEAAKITIYKVSDYFNASGESDNDAGVRVYYVSNGEYVQALSMDKDYLIVGESLAKGTTFAETVDKPGTTNSKNQGTTALKYKDSYFAGTHYIGGKGLTPRTIITTANDYTAADSSLKLYILAGNPRSSYKAGDADSAVVTCDNDSARLISNNPWSIASGVTNTGTLTQKGTATFNVPTVCEGATRYVKVVSLADGAQHLLPTGKAGFGKVSCNGEFATFYFTTAGAVSLVTSATPGLTSANVTTTEDNDTTLNIFDDGDGIGIENELGSTLNVLIDITYF